MDFIDFKMLSETYINDIYIWRNSDIVRSNSFNRNEISIIEHREFIKSLNEDITKKYFLAVLDNEPVGVVGFTDIHNRTANLGYYKNPFTKKTGIGKLLINKACEYAAITLNLELLIMKVFKTNLISIHCITQCGFTENKRDDEVIEYVLKLNKYGKR